MPDENDKAVPHGPITFHYIKSPQFREIFAEGMFGGVTPRGYISVALFKERFPIPLSVTHTFDEQGRLGEETERDSKDGIVRLVEANVYFDRTTALSMIDWLQEKVSELDELDKLRTQVNEEEKSVSN